LCGLACWSGRTEPLHRRYSETGPVSAKMTIPAAEFGVSAMIAHIRGYTECKSVRASDCDRRVVAGADRRGHRNLLSWGRSIRQARRQTTVPMIPCLRLLLPLQRSAGSEQRRGCGNHCFWGHGRMRTQLLAILQRDASAAARRSPARMKESSKLK
jgi:hypothetical protein